MHLDDVVDALLAGHFDLDRLESRVGPLRFDLQAYEKPIAQPWIRWPEDAPAARLESAPLLGFVASLNIRFKADMWHDDLTKPVRLGSRSISSWVALVRAPREVFERRLREKHGAPRVVTKRAPRGGTTACHVYGDGWRFFLRDAPEGGFWLEHGYATPEYAFPDCDPGVLHDFLAGLPAALAEIHTPADWIAFAARVPPDAGIVVHPSSSLEGAAKGTWSFLGLEIQPPLDAALIPELWRLPEAFAATYDVHMSSWYVAVPVQERFSSGETYRTFVKPVFGQWRVDASLDRWPKPEPGYEGEPKGPSQAYDLRRAEAAVRRLDFWLHNPPR